MTVDAAGHTAPPARRAAEDRADTTTTAARLRIAVTRLARQLRQQHTDDLTASQLSTLTTLQCHQPIRLGQLAAAEKVSAPTMTRLIAGLTDAGLLLRTPDPLDGRSAQLSLSPAGHDRLEQIRRDRTTLLTERLDRLAPDDYARLAAALPVLETLLEQDTAPTDSHPPG